MNKISKPVSNLSAAELIVTDFINSFTSGDFGKVKDLLAENVTAYITNADAKVNELKGPLAFMASIPNDILTIKPKVAITQLLSINSNQILVMVEVKAQRKGKELHNHAAYLMNVNEDKISEIWMVEALPAYSDEFWKS